MAEAEWAEARPGPVDGAAVWSARLCGAAGAMVAILSPHERARAERFVRGEDRDRYVASHAALRVILGAALGANPRDLALIEESHGKPALGGAHAGRLQFNFSHSGECALVAVSATARIGVDVEAARPFSDHQRVATAHFAASEASALAALPPEKAAAAFFACWTRKEAFVKALGLGLSLPLDRFSVSIPPAPAALLEIDGDASAARRWSLAHLEPMPGHVGAVAIAAPEAACRLLRLQADWADALETTACGPGGRSL